MKRRHLLAAAAVAAVPQSGRAQAFPERPIRFIVPYAPGGSTDTSARIVSEKLAALLGQPVIVENKPGGGTIIGTEIVAKATPDGYTLLLHHIGMATSATLYRKLAYKPLEAFEYVGLVTEVPMVIVGRKDLEPKDLKSLIEYVKANKDKVTYAHAGVGAASHLCGMLFMSKIETPLTTVPYKGTGPALTDLIGGQVDLLCDQTTNTTNQIKSGEIKAYATTSGQRLAALPDVPTAKEQGLDIEVAIWHGLYAPKGTPKAIVERLAASLQKALQDETVKNRFASLGTAPVPLDQAQPAALEAKLKGEIDRWRPVIQAAGQYAD